MKQIHQQSPYEITDREVPHVSPKFAVAAITVFLAFLILPMLFWGVLKMIPGGTAPFEVKLEENRKPFEMPDKLNVKTVTADIESYFNDRIPFRSALVFTHQQLTNAIEKPYRETLRPQLIQWLFAPPADTPTPTPPMTDPDLIFGETGEETTTESHDPPADPTLPPTEVEIDGDPACPHSYDSGTQITPATCEEDGWGTVRKVCQACGRTLKEYTEKLEHSMQLTLHVAPTCLADGKTVHTCSGCGKVTEELLNGGHTGSQVRTVEPSYTDYGYTLYQCDRCGGEYRTNVKNKLYDNSLLPLTIMGPQNAGAIEGKHKWLFYSGNNSIGYYQNTNPLSDQQLQNYAAILQELYNLCKAQGKEVRIMFMPNKEQIYWEYMPTLNVTPGDKRTQKFADYINENTDMEVIFPYEELRAAKPYWQVYSRLDTHWNAAGGFVGAQALCESLGLETVSMYDLPIVQDNSKTLSKSDLINIGQLNKADYGEDTDYIITYKPEVNMLSEKGGFETDDISVTVSDSENECNFVLLSDSFRKNMVPFLKKEFSNGLFTHRDKVKGDNPNPTVVQAIKDADIIVIAAVERIDTDVIRTAQKVIEILEENE